jgi:hypothetical protein
MITIYILYTVCYEKYGDRALCRSHTIANSILVVAVVTIREFNSNVLLQTKKTWLMTMIDIR